MPPKAFREMKRSHLLLSGAWLIHTAAWFLPVVDGDEPFPHGLPGLGAWFVSFCAVLPSSSYDTWYDRALVIVSAVSTPLFVLGSPWVIWRGSHSLRLASAWAAVSAFVINSHWYVPLFGSHRLDLRIGYFVWWLSFMVLGIGLFDSARRHTAGESKESQSTSATSG